MQSPFPRMLYHYHYTLSSISTCTRILPVSYCVLSGLYTHSVGSAEMESLTSYKVHLPTWPAGMWTNSTHRPCACVDMRGPILMNRMSTRGRACILLILYSQTILFYESRSVLDFVKIHNLYTILFQKTHYQSWSFNTGENSFSGHSRMLLVCNLFRCLRLRFGRCLAKYNK